MGQKTHPVGLRLGLHRKWSSSWFVSTVSTTALKCSSVVCVRGGVIRSNREDILCSFLRRLPDLAHPRSAFASRKSESSAGSISETSVDQSPFRSSSNFVPVDLQIVVGSGGSLFVLFFYSKLQGRN